MAADGIPVAVACRVLGISRAGFYEWSSRPPSARQITDAALLETIRRVHADSRHTYGAPRVLAELRLGLGIHVARKRVARIVRAAGLRAVSHPRRQGVLVQGEPAAPARPRIKAVIPEPADQTGHRKRRGSRGGRPPGFDADDYRGRNVIERRFCDVKQWRGLATRYDKLAIVYRAATVLHAIIAWTRRLRDTP
jgi:transposase InsO family protein